MIVYLSLIAVRAPTPPEATAIAIAGMALGPRTPTAATDVTVPAKKQALCRIICLMNYQKAHFHNSDF